jgi:hypothetical protein
LCEGIVTVLAEVDLNTACAGPHDWGVLPGCECDLSATLTSMTSGAQKSTGHQLGDVFVLCVWNRLLVGLLA